MLTNRSDGLPSMSTQWHNSLCKVLQSNADSRCWVKCAAVPLSESASIFCQHHR